MKVVIMAGGKGTRISSIAGDLPKPMLPVGGRPVLEHEIQSLREQGFTDLILTVSHLSGKIMDYFGDGSGLSPATGRPFGVHIQYFREETPLGNAGALLKLRRELTEDFLLLNGDVIFDVDFHRMIRFHREKGALATLLSHPNSHPYDSALLVADGEKRVMRWLTKEEPRPDYYENRVNGGLHIIGPAALDSLPLDGDRVGAVGPDGKIIKVDLDRQILKPLAGTGKMYCYDSPEYVKDMGTPERYEAVCRDFEAGEVRRKNLRNPQRAVFLDRDGTINRYVGFLRRAEQFALLEGAAEAVRRINAAGYLAVVTTNQPVIARGETTEEELAEIHRKMETLLGREGAYLDGIYYCPHHPDGGFPGEVPALKIRCDCRKPAPGLLCRAAADFHIDLKSSWMVGDGGRDVGAGKNAGCRTALISRGGEDFGQDVTVGSLLEFTERYL